MLHHSLIKHPDLEKLQELVHLVIGVEGEVLQ